ncbi:type VII secretion-associated protein, Rv3446c family, C-terminal domain-containing protein [Amycolatopsis arida]|uniref:Type VII secretion-associated protein, Rv3446c family, C-terminal domain-containing protein n=1 Tax=Amycolatopsis arida TaxID=587909 RepID=A0A1I5X3P5_9PSEU|nr:type VII secretion-associated protein [Amycolatopsis arida]TDX92577.1 type VII secretion-associated protein (TIGR03931 family) [Amycolatopsis arida]SFQ26297.1 type VII secretion-associated protein, Rv3446c family, C-terminal domain-containing protein [Amycolatopsis arida]
MTVRVAVDFGTSSTCVVVSVNGREPQVVVIDGQPLLSSAVYAAEDGTLFVGQEAERQAAVDPSRYEPHPKRRIDEGELLLGDRVLRVVDVVHAVLSRAVAEARRLAGGAEVDLLVLTHPADWGAMRTRLLRQAAGRLAHEVALVPEPVAAAVFHAATAAPTEVNQDRTVEFSGQVGDTLAVLDLGGGTVDVSVVRRMPAAGGRRGPRGGVPGGGRGAGFQVLATRGDPSFGGADVDQALLEHVGSLVSAADPEAWRQLVEGRELTDRRRRRVLRQDVRGAKETLSRHSYTDVPMPPPFADAHVTREDLERLIAAPLGRAVELTVATIEAAGVRPRQLTAIFLVGGSSRIPMVSRLVHERTGVVPTTLDQPETVVARGALRAVLVEADRTGVLPGTGRSGPPRGVRDQRTEVVGPRDIPRPGFPPPPPRPGPRSAPTARAPQATQPPPPKPMPGWAESAASPSPHGQPAVAVGAPPEAVRDGAPRRPDHRRRYWLAGGALALVAALAVTVLLLRDDSGPVGRTFAQYNYVFVAPQDWTQTEDEIDKRQVIVKPADAAQGSDLVVVQEFTLPYDGGAERDRLVADLQRLIEDSQRNVYSDFSPSLRYGDKDVIYYKETKPAAIVDWYVYAGGTVQVSVGCQYAALRDRVASACEQIVRTLEIRN